MATTDNQTDKGARQATVRARNVTQRPLPRIMLVCVITAVLAALVLWKPAPQSVKPTVNDVVTYTTDVPEEVPVAKEVFEWKGAAEDPKRIIIPSINTKGFIQKMGVDQNNQISAPTNIYFAGWFIDSAKPGQPGLSIIDGHVDGKENTGIFKRLGELAKDDTFEVELGSGTILRYRVLDTQTVDTNGAENTLFSQNPAVKSQLNLITCGGTYDRQAQLYDKRVIVSSELIQ